MKRIIFARSEGGLSINKIVCGSSALTLSGAELGG